MFDRNTQRRSLGIPSVGYSVLIPYPKVLDIRSYSLIYLIVFEIHVCGYNGYEYAYNSFSGNHLHFIHI